MANVTLLGSYGNQSNADFMFRNRIINGNFDFWQRSTSATSGVASATGGYGAADRWKFIGHESGTSFTSVSLTRITDVPPNSKFAAKLVSSSAGVDDAVIAQIIESINTYDLVGKPVTLSLYLKRLGTLANFDTRIDISYLDVSDTAPSSLLSPTGATVISSRVLTQANFSTNWTQYTLTINNLPAQAANGLMVRIAVLGTNLGSGDLFALSQVQLEVGTTATPFERRFYGIEFALCQRYYEITSSMSQTYSAGVVAVNGNSHPTWGMAKWDYKVSKRVSPTLQIFCGNDGFGFSNRDPKTATLDSPSYGNVWVSGDESGCFAQLVNVDNALPGNPYIYGMAVRADAEL